MHSYLSVARYYTRCFVAKNLVTKNKYLKKIKITAIHKMTTNKYIEISRNKKYVNTFLNRKPQPRHSNRHQTQI